MESLMQTFDFNPIDKSAWSEVPFVAGRIADEEDVVSGRAVFFIKPGPFQHNFIPIEIPFLATIKSDEQEVIVIQAELVEGHGEVAGFRYVEGGCGVCLMSELDQQSV
jgi:hypothetical protein